MTTNEIYRAAHRVIGRLTPLDIDCGRLCNARCCRGDDEWGMLLFPHEQEVLSSGGLTVKPTTLRGVDCAQAVCNGRCIRALRPLSCRIFPLAPYLKNGELSVVFDPRASFCPLSHSRDSITTAFAQSVHDAFALLRTIDCMDEFLTVFASVLDDYNVFNVHFTVFQTFPG